MLCPHCHAEGQHGRFCAKCGEPLYAATDADAPAPDAEPPVTAPAAEEAAPADEASAQTAAQQPETTETLPAEALPRRAAAQEQPAVAPPPLQKTPTESSSRDTQPEKAISVDAAPAAAAAAPRIPRKALAMAGLVCGLALAAAGGYALFNHFFSGETESQQAAIAEAPIVAPSGTLASDTVVGHWRHYSDGSVIEKIGTDTYRWTIGDDAYQMKFKDGVYLVEDDRSNTYTFTFSGPNRLVLTESIDAGGGLVKDPVFETGFYCGRVGQDGSLSQNLSINPDAFDIIGHTYGELAGIYGPGALTVINDDQYIIFRGNGGNFAVQFSGQTVPLKTDGKGYTVARLTSGNTSSTAESVSGSANNTGTANGNGNGTATTEGNAKEQGTTGGTGSKTEEKSKEESRDYKLEIPDMPTFPSYTAVATGTVWMDLGFLVNNCPETMSVDDLSAVLGISLEVGQAPASASGYTFYGMADGYFAGTYSSDTHTFNVTGYGNANLSRDKTQVFIQMIS